MEDDTLESSLKNNKQFLQTVFKEVHKFASGDVQNSVLLFPALLKRERFLTHKVVKENFESFCSFSLGENCRRRTAVCLKSRVVQALTSLQCNHERVHRLALTLCRQQGLPVDFLSYSMKKAATNETGSKAVLPPSAERRQRRPDMQLYVPRRRNPESEPRAVSNCVHQDGTGKWNDCQLRQNTEIKGPRVATGEALSSQNRLARCHGATQIEPLNRSSKASTRAVESCNAPQQQKKSQHLQKPYTKSTEFFGDHNEGKSPKPSTNAEESARKQKRTAALGQQDVPEEAHSSKSLHLLPGKRQCKGDETSKHSSALEESWNSEILIPPMSLGGMSSTSDVQAAQAKPKSVKISKSHSISENASPEDLCSVPVQAVSKVEKSLKSPVLLAGEGSLKDTQVVPLQSHSTSDESSELPALSREKSFQDLCTAGIDKGSMGSETLKLPVGLERVNASEGVHTVPVRLYSQNDEALRPSTMSEESKSSKDLCCMTTKNRSKPDKRLNPCSLSEGLGSLKDLRDVPLQGKSDSDEMVKSPVASGKGSALESLNDVLLEELSKSNSTLKVSPVSEVDHSERESHGVPVQVELENDGTLLTPLTVTGKDDTSQESWAAPVQNIFESDEVWKHSTSLGEVSSLNDFRDMLERGKSRSGKITELLIDFDSTCLPDLHSTLKNASFEREELSTSAILEEINLSEDLCAMSEQAETKIDASLERAASTAEDTCPIKGAQSVPEQSRSECNETFNFEVASTKSSSLNPVQGDDKNHDSWDALFDESGECFDPEVLKDITQALGDIKVQHAELDYTKFEPCIPDLSEAEYGHILEIYNFPPEFETKDVVAGLSASRDQFSIKWVDDTHVLAVFSTPFAATEALSLQTPLMRMRHISEASKQSKLKVKRCAEFLQPFKPRPQTSASVARRLVSGALGLRVQVEPEQRRRELQVLREAKGRRRTATKQRTDAWNGDVA